MKNFNPIHAEALYIKFCAIYGDKFVKNYHNDDFKIIWYEEWCTGLKGIDVFLIKEALEECKITLAWPPSIAEFRSICERIGGVPSSSQALNCAIRGDFSHPIVKLAYDKVGSWDMKHLSEANLIHKWDIAYQDALNLFRQNEALESKQLEDFNDRGVLRET